MKNIGKNDGKRSRNERRNPKIGVVVDDASD